jgi:proteasome lid subunit RPN8/RPN11
MESSRKPGGLHKFQVTDREECGLIIQRIDDDGVMFYVVKVPNHSTEACDYEIHKRDVDRVKEVLSQDESIYGFMHTHLPEHDCDPSDRDFEGAARNPEMENLIYQPSTKKFCWYGPEVIVDT